VKTTTTFAILNAQLSARQHADTMRQSVPYNLQRQLRLAGVTIRQLAAFMDTTLVRVREVRAMSQVPYLVALDFQDAIEGVALRNAARAERAAIVAILPASWRRQVRVATFASAAWCAKQRRQGVA